MAHSSTVSSVVSRILLNTSPLQFLCVASKNQQRHGNNPNIQAECVFLTLKKVRFSVIS